MQRETPGRDGERTGQERREGEGGRKREREKREPPRQNWLLNEEAGKQQIQGRQMEEWKPQRKCGQGAGCSQAEKSRIAVREEERNGKKSDSTSSTGLEEKKGG